MTVEERYANETVSHSGLSSLRFGPRAYRRYKDFRDTEKSFSLSLGTAVHAYILEPDEFYDRYTEAPEEVPTPMYKAFVEELHRTAPEDPKLLQDPKMKHSWYENAYKVAGFKRPNLPGVITKFEEESKYKTYYQFLSENEGKSVLTDKDMMTIKMCKESSAQHKLAAMLLYGMPFADGYNEIDISFSYPGYKFNLHGVIDRLVVDVAQKKCFIVDVKTTSKSVMFFEDSFWKYGYHRQMYLYILAARHYLKEQGHNPDEFAISPYIVAIQTNGNYDTAVLQPTMETVLEGRREVEELLETLKWHFENDKWDYPQYYYEGNGALSIGITE